MLKFILNSLKIANDSIILIAPLSIFTMILYWYFNNVILNQNDLEPFIMSILTMFILVCGFLSLWIYMVKKVIGLSKKVFLFENDRTKELLNIILKSPKGVGKYFLSIIGIIFSYILLFLVSILMINNGHNLQISEFLSTKYGVIKLLLSTIFILFTTILWLPEIVYSEKNYFKSLYFSIIKNFIYFRHTIVLFLIITILLGITITSLIYLIESPLLYFCLLMIFYYLFVFSVVLIFTYYEQIFLKDTES